MKFKGLIGVGVSWVSFSCNVHGNDCAWLHPLLRCAVNGFSAKTAC